MMIHKLEMNAGAVVLSVAIGIGAWTVAAADGSGAVKPQTNVGAHHQVPKTPQSKERNYDELLQWLRKLPMMVMDAGHPMYKLKAEQLKTIESLDLSKMRVTDKDLIPLKQLDTLTELNLSRAQIGTEAVRSISSLKKLRSLTLYYAKTDENTLVELLEGLPNSKLNSLDLSGITQGKDSTKALSKITSITGLSCIACGLGDDNLSDVANLPKLTSLNLENNRQITSRGLGQLSSLKALKTLNLLGIKLGDESIATLAGYKSLTSLNIKYTGISDEGFAALKKALPNCKISFARICAKRSLAPSVP